MIQIADRLANSDPKILALIADLRRVNQRLPAAVYIPFVKSLNRYNIF